MRDPNEFIDDVVKDGEGSSFQYKNEYWEEMASLLDANDIRKKRKALLLWTSSAASLLLLVVASWAILGTDMLYQERPSDEIASFSDNNVSYYMQQYKVIANSADQEKMALQEERHIESVQQVSNSTNNVANNIINSQETKLIAEQKKMNLSEEINTLHKIEANTPELLETDINNTLALTNEKFELPKVEEIFVSRHHLNLDGGVGISGLTGEKTTSLSYHAGLTYSYDLNQNWSIQTGVRYLSQATSLRKTEEFSKYSFKRTDEHLHLNYDRIHYAQLPVGVSYKYKKSLFSFNVMPSYAVAVESSFQHTKYDHDTESFNVLEENSKNYGVTDGINKFDLQIGLSYEYALTSFMNIGANASIGTLDVTPDEYWGAQNKNLNFNASAYLKFNLF